MDIQAKLITKNSNTGIITRHKYILIPDILLISTLNILSQISLLITVLLPPCNAENMEPVNTIHK